MTLSPSQQSMLDLAVSCDLADSPVQAHAAIKARRNRIVTQEQADPYVKELEERIRSRRPITPATALTSPALPPSRFTAAPPPMPPMPSMPPAPLQQLPLVPSPRPRPLPPAISPNACVVIGLGLLLVLVVAGWKAPAGIDFLLIMVSMACLIVTIGYATTRNPLGIIINERNVMSLSRLQTALWTIVILGAYLAYALARIKGALAGASYGDHDGPLNIVISDEDWALLGISATSLAGSGLILGTKKTVSPTPLATAISASQNDTSPQNINLNRQGVLFANASVTEARITDIFEGDEIGNTASIDIAKVQMFYFTIIALISFCVSVYVQMRIPNAPLKELPFLPSGFLVLMGISHGGYLASKGIGKTQIQQPPPTSTA